MENTSQQSAYTDQELVQRACRGESIAFSQLVSKYYERSVRVAYGMLRRREDAEDVVQRRFVALTESSQASKDRPHSTRGFIESSSIYVLMRRVSVSVRVWLTSVMTSSPDRWRPRTHSVRT